VSSDNLLKGFGVGADVIGQLANAKALRRKSTGTTTGFDITDGELLEDVSVLNGAQDIRHSLGRVPAGAVILKAPAGNTYSITATALNAVTLVANFDGSVTLWVV